MSRKLPELVFYYRGRVERGKRFEWRKAYSPNGPLGEIVYPWLTRRECQILARKEGKRAVFKG